MIWFLPPFSNEVNFNVGRYFLGLVDKHFHKDHKYRMLFNRHNLKIGFSTTPNFRDIVKNKRKPIQDARACSCRNINSCPLEGNCMVKSIVYEARVTYNENDTVQTKRYIGVTQRDFKSRFYNHISSFRYPYKRGTTRLSDFIWRLKEKGITYDLKWKILKRCRPYRSGSRICNICDVERWLILKGTYKKKNNLLNVRKQLLEHCPHRARQLLYFWSPEVG